MSMYLTVPYTVPCKCFVVPFREPTRQKELTAEEVATMKIADFCTTYKSRLPPKPREKGAKVHMCVFVSRCMCACACVCCC